MMINKEAVLVDHTPLTHKEKFDPFIYTDLFAAFSGKHKLNLFHFWEMEKEVVLGMQDTRVTHLNKGVDTLHNHGYGVVVRNSGGLAVVADEGILNLSVIIPQGEGKYAFSIDEGYILMKQLIEAALSEYAVKIDAHEVKDSYCPGDFDLSINGKKIAGIAQRRIKNGIAIMIYLSVSGNQSQRGELVRQFYQESLDDAFGIPPFPPVNPDSMTTLSDCLNRSLTVKEMKEKLVAVIEQTYTVLPAESNPLKEYLDSENFTSDYKKQHQRMTQRNDILFDLEEQ